MGGSTRLDESFVVLDPTKHAKLNLQGEYIQQQSFMVNSVSKNSNLRYIQVYCCKEPMNTNST